MGSFGGFEWVIVLLAVLLLFGAKRIPELARGLGQGIQEFRKASDDIKKEIEDGGKAKSQPQQQQETQNQNEENNKQSS